MLKLLAPLFVALQARESLDTFSASLHAGSAGSDDYACCDRCGRRPPKLPDRCASGFSGMAAKHLDVRSGAPICCNPAASFLCGNAARGAHCDSCKMMLLHACTCTSSRHSSRIVVQLTLHFVTATRSCHHHLTL